MLRRPLQFRRAGRHNSSWTAIDTHSHFLPKSWPCLATRHGGEGWPSRRHSGPLPEGTFGYNRTCAAMLMSGGEDFRPVTNACWDVRARLDDLDRFGVHSQIISATPILFQWDRPRESSLDVARHFNDAALEMCSASHGRLHALCQVRPSPPPVPPPLPSLSPQHHCRYHRRRRRRRRR